MPESSQDNLWNAVRMRRRGVLATIGEDGMPHLTNVHYLAEEPRVVRITTTVRRVKGINLMRESRAALHVQDEDDWFAYCVAAGPVTVMVAEAPGDEATDQLHQIFTAFRGPQSRPAFDEDMIRKGRLIARLDVERLYGLLPQSAPARSA